MPRADWKPLRRVAENIAADDRSYWNLKKIPELSFSSAAEAVETLVGLGVVINKDSTVEPTPSFLPWLSELRQKEDVRKTNETKTTPEPPAPASIARDVQTSNQPSPKPRKLQFRKLGLDAVKELAARIFETLRHRGPMKKREIERTLNAHRFGAKHGGKDLWEEAWDYLLARKAIAVGNDGTVTVLNDRVSLPDPYPSKPVRKKKRKRPPTRWFKELQQRSLRTDMSIAELLDADRLARNQPWIRK